MSLRNITILCCLIFLMASHASAEPRTWKNREGKTLTGELIEKKKTEVVILKGEKEFTVKIDDLSDEDQEWVKELVPYMGFEYKYESFEHKTTKTITTTEYGPKKTTVKTPFGPVGVIDHSSTERSVSRTNVPVVTQKFQFRVTSIDEDSPAAKAGIETGTIITKINGKEFRTAEEYEKWNASNFSKTRRYTIRRNSQIGSLLAPNGPEEKTIAIQPEWRNRKEEAEKEAKRIATEKKEAERIVKEKDTEEFGEAIVEFIRPGDFKEPEKQLVTAKEEAFAANFAQETIKSYLKFKHDAVFNKDTEVLKLLLDIPEKKNLTCWSIKGTVKAPNAAGAFLTYEYEVRYIEKNGTQEVVYATLGDDVKQQQAEDNSNYAKYMRKRKNQILAEMTFNRYITEEKEYGEMKKTPEIGRDRLLLDIRSLFVYTQRIVLEKPESAEQIDVKYLGNLVYEVRCKDLVYIKYGDDVYTISAQKNAIDEFYSTQKINREISDIYANDSALSKMVKNYDRELDESLRWSIEKYAVMLDFGYLNLVAKIQYRLDAEEGETQWTFIEVPRITKMQSAKTEKD